MGFVGKWWRAGTDYFRVGERYDNSGGTACSQAFSLATNKHEAYADSKTDGGWEDDGAHDTPYVVPVAFALAGVGPHGGWVVSMLDVTGENGVVTVANGGEGSGVTTAIGVVLEGSSSVGGG